MAHEKRERNARMQQEYEAGDSLRTIAKRHGRITPERVRQILARRGVAMRPPTGGGRTSRRGA